MDKLRYMNWRASNYAMYTGIPLVISSAYGGRPAGEIWYDHDIDVWRTSRDKKTHKTQASAIQHLFPRTWITNLPDERGY